MSKLLTDYRGKRTKKVHLSAPELQSLKYIFFVSVVPTQKETSELRAARFEDSIMKALQIFPPLGKQLNLDYIGDRWAQHNNEDPERLFAQEQTQQGAMQGMMGMQTPISNQMQQKQPPQPSLNTLVNQG